MPRQFSNSTDFPYSWRQTALAVLHKYPNPQATHVVSMDVIDQRYDAETGQLRLERILGVRQGAPKWVMKLIGGREDTYVREITVVDASKKSVEMTSTNMSMSNIILVREYITYLPTPPLSSSPPAAASSSSSSTFSQTASIQSQMKGILAAGSGKIEEWSFGRFGDNAAKGKEGLMDVLSGLWGTPSSASATR